MSDNEQDIEFLRKKLAACTVEDVESWKPEEDYYLHIDVLHGSSQLVSRRINSFMIRNDAFDPRRIFNFPTDLMEEGERDTLKNRRAWAGVGDSYYELWKVRKNFSLAKFREMVEKLPPAVQVRIVRFIDNDHDINVYESKT